jgi:hypothetical protein
MRLSKENALIAACAMAIAGSYTAATAQTQMAYTPRYSGMTGSSVAGCPNIAWRIGQSPSGGTLHGMIWFTDMSGMSQADGSINGDHFNLTLRSVMGNGPVGTVTGVRGQHARLVGTGCANATWTPVVINSYGSGG